MRDPCIFRFLAARQKEVGEGIDSMAHRKERFQMQHLHISAGEKKRPRPSDRLSRSEDRLMR